MNPQASIAWPTTLAGRSRRPTTGRTCQPLLRGGKASQTTDAVSSPRAISADCLSAVLPFRRAPRATARLDFPLPYGPVQVNAPCPPLGDVARHGLQDLGRRRRADESVQGLWSAEIQVDADRSLKTSRATWMRSANAITPHPADE